MPEYVVSKKDLGKVGTMVATLTISYLGVSQIPIKYVGVLKITSSITK